MVGTVNLKSSFPVFPGKNKELAERKFVAYVIFRTLDNANFALLNEKL